MKWQGERPKGVETSFFLGAQRIFEFELERKIKRPGTKNFARPFVYGGSTWESNPPETVLTPHTGFEVREHHQNAACFHFLKFFKTASRHVSSETLPALHEFCQWFLKRPGEGLIKAWGHLVLGFVLKEKSSLR